MRRLPAISLLVLTALLFAGRANANAVAAAPELDADQLTSGIALVGAVLLMYSHRRLRMLVSR